MELLNTQGEYRACYFNVEKGQAFRDDVEKAFETINGALVSRAEKWAKRDLNTYWLNVEAAL